MKKIVFLIFCFSLIGVVSADTYYSDYSKFSDYQEEMVLSSDLVDVEVEDRYLWYQEKKVGDYFIFGEQDSIYSQVDMNRVKETRFSKWDSVVPEAKENRVMEHRVIYWYQEMLPARYVHLYDLRGENGLNIVELLISYKDELIDYDVLCKGCVSEEKNSFVVSEGGELFIDLGKEYSYADLNVTMVLHDESTLEKRYVFDITYDSEGKDVLASRLSRLWFTNKKEENKEICFGGENSYLLKDIKWGDEHYTTKEISENSFLKVRREEQYRYKDLLYYYYYLERTYKNGYDTVGNKTYPLQDLDSKKTFYSYRTRDKVVLKEPIVIDSDEDVIEDFILEVSGEYEVDVSKVNFSKNGVYPIVIQTDKQKIKKEITVTKNNEELVDIKDFVETKENGFGELEEEGELVVYQNIEKNSEEVLNEISLLREEVLKKEKEVQILEQRVMELTSDFKACLNEKSTVKEINSLEKEKEDVVDASIQKQGGWVFGFFGILISLFIILFGRKLRNEN